MSQHHCTVATTIHVTVDQSAILSWKGNPLLRGGDTGKC